MANDFYYTSGGNPYGPVSADELRELAGSGRLKPQDLVRGANRSDWVRASQVKDLFPPAAPPPPTPPPFPEDVAPQSPFAPSNDSEQWPSYRRAVQDRFQPATSVLHIFDWRFEKYLTPWIVRITWIVFLVSFALTLLWIAYFIVAIVAGGNPLGGGLGLLNISLVAIAFSLATYTIGIAATMMWVRVVLEMIIVVFNIATTLSRMEKQLNRVAESDAPATRTQ